MGAGRRELGAAVVGEHAKAKLEHAQHGHPLDHPVQREGFICDSSSGVPSRLSSLRELQALTAGWVMTKKGQMSCVRACHALPPQGVRQEDTWRDGCGHLQGR